jgi:hypothetical protein
VTVRVPDFGANTVMLNSFQHPCCDLAAVREWILKQVQDDKAALVT